MFNNVWQCFYGRLKPLLNKCDNAEVFGWRSGQVAIVIWRRRISS
ncbi:MAG: hypothetical protein V7K53_30070 [Nostoc sp.]